MIILIGPDGTGKTTLAKRLEERGLRYSHFTKDSSYQDYITPLCKLEMMNAVLDRYMLCEYSYSICMNRPFKYSLKQWHNVILLTLAQNPLIVLCTHKPLPVEYSQRQYLPYDRWDNCLQLYKSFLVTHHIIFFTYDYGLYYGPEPSFTQLLIRLSEENTAKTTWWRKHWREGYGCIGSSAPRFLLVAERLGPNNVNNLPFETGPTGYMLSGLLHNTGTPLGTIAITNMVKAPRKDSRPVNTHDLDLFEEELVNLRPKKVIFMGSVAKRGIKLALEHGCEVDTITHLGSLNYKGVKDMTGYYNEWRKILGIVPVVKFT